MNVLLNHFKPFVLFCVLRVIECVDENLCSACGSLVGTFMEGMERTQRSGFAGGNTDWEQRALGSYMSSEVRYAEITDHLCKSNDKIKLDKDEEHKCHALYEKYEELIEGWYHHKQGHSNLESYLCVENIKACCRKDTCGPNCDPCPDSFNGICSSHGHFEDSKLGNKICHCDKGYKGDWCDDCAENYFQASKNDTHVLCQRCHKSCSNGCSGPSNRDCAKCKAGWSFAENRGCEDIDECSSDVPTCKGERKICINTEGSFKCECTENFVQDDNGNCVPDVKGREVSATDEESTDQNQRLPTDKMLKNADEEKADVSQYESSKSLDDRPANLVESEQDFKRKPEHTNKVLDGIHVMNDGVKEVKEL